MISFSKTDIQKLPHLHKINLINSIAGYKSANLIGTKSIDGISNVAVFSSVVHYGSSPAILGFVIRPTSVPRNTYENIKSSQVYTINSITENNFKDAHHTSAKYPPDVSEFEKTNLKEEYKNDFKAPFVKNAPLQLAMKFLEEYHIKANNTILVLGEVENIFLQPELLESDFFVNLSKGKVATINGLDSYTTPQTPFRLPYQRPKQEL